MKRPDILVLLTFVFFVSFYSCDGEDSQSGKVLTVTGIIAGEAVSFSSPENTRILIHVNDEGMLVEMLILDGPLIDPENPSEWEAYWQENDVWLSLIFEDPEPAEPHTMTGLYDSFIIMRGVGFAAFSEHGGGERLIIEEIDMSARWIKMHFEIPVVGYCLEWPLVYENCTENPESIEILNGDISGNFELH